MVRKHADEPSAEFLKAWELYPKRQGENSRKNAWKAWQARIREGVPAEELIEAVRRYAAFVRATGKEGTSYVKMGKTFFGPGEHWKEAYDVPAQGGAARFERGQDVPDQVARRIFAEWPQVTWVRRLPGGGYLDNNDRRYNANGRQEVVL